MARTSAADLSHGLKDATFPMNTRQLAEHARQNRAPDEVVETIKHMPDREFGSLADVEHVFSQSQQGEEQANGSATEAARKGGTRRRKH
ncbi:MAG: DUF2795 domain-containing protein [Rhodomicrobium sp.]